MVGHADDKKSKLIELRSDGLGDLVYLYKGDLNDKQYLAEIEKALPTFNVVRQRDHFTVKRGAVLVALLYPNKSDQLDVIVLGEFPTEQGLKVGDTGKALFDANPGRHCEFAAPSLPAPANGRLQCRIMNLIWVLDDTKYKGPRTGRVAEADVSTLKITAIATKPTGP
jgi:hypothetical protein